MIGRRTLLAGGAALAAPVSGLAVPPDLRFDVMRNGSLIGHHTIGFHGEGDSLVANVAVDIVVRIGPIPVFRYTLSVREIWRDGRFLSLESETNDDGKHFHVNAGNSGGQVVVETAKAPRAVLPPETIPLTHWNELCMRRKLFNPQDGVPIDSKVVDHGEEMVALANGHEVCATHYALVGKVALDDWYDTDRQWTALRSTGTDGSRIEYRRAA
jgi:hypothetical protein